MNTGNIVRISESIAITIGKVVTVYPVGFGLPDSGAVPPADGPTMGAVVSVSRGSTAGTGYFAKVRLMAPGKPNNNRIVTVVAADVADPAPQDAAGVEMTHAQAVIAEMRADDDHPGMYSPMQRIRFMDSDGAIRTGTVLSNPNTAWPGSCDPMGFYVLSVFGYAGTVRVERSQVVS